MNPLTRISFEVPGEPVAKERPRTNMATGVVYTPAKTKNYEETVKWCYQMAAHGARFPDNEPLSMLVVAYRPIPKSASAKKKSLMRAGAERPITKPDWDNVGKIVSDALNGIAYRDDSQIVDAQHVGLLRGRCDYSLQAGIQCGFRGLLGNPNDTGHFLCHYNGEFFRCRPLALAEPQHRHPPVRRDGENFLLGHAVLRLCRLRRCRAGIRDG